MGHLIITRCPSLGRLFARRLFKSPRGDRISRAPAPAATAATAYLIPTLMLYFIDTFPDRFLRARRWP